MTQDDREESVGAALSFLQQWYAYQCNGEWEHDRGIKIESLDNPGWQVSIDLEGTDFPTKTDRVLTIEGDPPTAANGNVGGASWLVCEIRSGTFTGAGDSNRIGQILEIFESTFIAGPHAQRRPFQAESELQVRFSKEHGIPMIDLDEFKISPEVTKLVRRELAAMHRAVPINRAGTSIVVALAEPNVAAIDALGVATGLNVEVVVASEQAIERALLRYYGVGNAPKP